MNSLKINELANQIEALQIKESRALLPFKEAYKERIEQLKDEKRKLSGGHQTFIS